MNEQSYNTIGCPRLSGLIIYMTEQQEKQQCMVRYIGYWDFKMDYEYYLAEVGKD